MNAVVLVRRLTMIRISKYAAKKMKVYQAHKIVPPDFVPIPIMISKMVRGILSAMKLLELKRRIKRDKLAKLLKIIQMQT